MKRPLVVIAIAFLLGIIISSFLPVLFWPWVVGAVLFAIMAVFIRQSEWKFWIFIVLCVFCLASSVLNLHRILPSDHIAKITPIKGIQVELIGLVANDPTLKSKKNVFILDAQSVDFNGQSIRVSGKVLVWDFSNAEINYKDKVLLSGTLFAPFPLQISERLNYQDYLRKMDIFTQLNVKKQAEPVILQKNTKFSIELFSKKIKNRINQMLRKYMSADAAGLIGAMILGSRQDAPQFFNQALQRTGTVHILAVSGLHTGIIIFIVLILLKIIKIPYRSRYGLAILFIIFYCILTGMRTSVIRSTVMAVVFLFSFIVDRDYDTYSSLALSALIILWFMPGQAFEIGFQLSFGSVLAIILFHPRIASWLGTLSIKQWQKNLISGLGVSLSAWAGTLGLVAYYFLIISPISIVANLFIVPLLSLVIASGLLFISLGTLVPASCPILALNCEFFISLIYRIANFLASLPGAYFEFSQVNVIYIYGYYIVVGVLFYAKDIKRLVEKLLNITGLTTSVH